MYTGILETTDVALSDNMPGIYEKDVGGTPVVVPGSNAGVIAGGQLLRTNVSHTEALAAGYLLMLANLCTHLCVNFNKNL